MWREGKIVGEPESTQGESEEGEEIDCEVTISDTLHAITVKISEVVFLSILNI